MTVLDTPDLATALSGQFIVAPILSPLEYETAPAVPVLAPIPQDSEHRVSGEIKLANERRLKIALDINIRHQRDAGYADISVELKFPDLNEAHLWRYAEVGIIPADYAVALIPRNGEAVSMQYYPESGPPEYDMRRHSATKPVIFRFTPEFDIPDGSFPDITVQLQIHGKGILEFNHKMPRY
jgi:hypothetical protein